MSEIIRTCCKINLFLQVTGRREDNYHTLYTLFLPVKDMCDEIECDLDSAPGIDVSVRQTTVPGGKENIIYKAAELYAETAGVEPHWSFILDKRLPVSAGLGSGSSNAAGVLLYLNDKLGALDKKELYSLAAKIGADVPFFLDPVPTWARGIGNEFEALESKPEKLYLVLANPGFPVSVRWSYGKLDPASFSPADVETGARLSRALISGNASGVAAACRNDLGEALFGKFPRLELMRRLMLDSGALTVQVSGSGPTLFAVTPDAEIRSKVAEALKKEFANSPGVRIFECEA